MLDAEMEMYGQQDIMVHGQLGIGDKATQTLPQQMVSISGIKEIAAKTNHSVMLTEGGYVLSAGSSTIITVNGRWKLNR